ncbi:hypothetical protein VTN96DRAFT_759 [Rasamsonia emersonii]
MAGFLGSVFKREPSQKVRVRHPISEEFLGLKTLYSPSNKDVDSEDISLDIVAVHGIGADPYFTWVTNKVHWLENTDMLPGSFPNSRIMSFG